MELYLQNCNFSIVETLGIHLITLGKIPLYLFFWGFYRYFLNISNFSAKNAEKYGFRRQIDFSWGQMNKSQFH